MSEYERLKELLLSEERAELARLAERADQHDLNKDALPRELPALIERSAQLHPDGRLTKALAEPVADALGDAVQARPQVIVDALFPIIGPAIRRALAEAMRALSADINRALESSLTPRGLGWRIESWRTGVSYPQVVLKHTLRFRIDHLFLIERESGLVIHRESAPGLPDLDSDAIAGMLTAIGEFVKDSVGREQGGALNSASVGEHLLWVLEGPRANLAVFIRGVPPATLQAVLQARLEELHQRYADPMAQLRGGGGDMGAMLADRFDISTLDREGRGGEAAPHVQQGSRRPLAIALVVVAALLLGWLLRDWLWDRRLERVETTLTNWPGLFLQELDSDPYDAVTVRGLLDALADSPRAALLDGELRGYALDLDLRGYVSSDPEIVLRRARQVLAPPAGVTVGFTDGVLTLTGMAPAEWIADAGRTATAIPGVVRVELAGLLPESDPMAEARAKLGQLTQRIEERRITFIDEIAPAADADSSLAGLVADLAQARQLASTLGGTLSVRTFGVTDEPGGEELNRGLRQQRAQWLAERLSAAVPGLSVEPGPVTEMASLSAKLDVRGARSTITFTPDPQ